MTDKDKPSDVERLVLAQAIYNAAGKLVSTKDPDSLRSEIDREYKKLYDMTGSKSFDVKLRGQEVGTYSVKFSQAKPPETVQQFVVNDYEKLAKAVEELDISDYANFIYCNLQQFAEFVLNETGEMLDGCEVKTIPTYGRPKEYIGGSLRLDLHKVADVVRGELPQSFVAMLEGGE